MPTALVSQDGGMPSDYRLYGDLAEWWPLISPPEEYVEEAAHLAAVFGSATPRCGRCWTWAAAAATSPPT